MNQKVVRGVVAVALGGTVVYTIASAVAMARPASPAMGGMPMPASLSASPAPAAPTSVTDIPASRTRTVTLVAAPGHLTIRRGQTVPVWTFNGTVPGPEIRVYQGDRVRVTLVNHLPWATTIHWHGLLDRNSNDGVAGVTQDAVLPGHSYTYDFVARDPGTYWYHPHQKSAEEVDKGLYGALVILPHRAAVSPAVDRTLVLDDWPLTGAMATGMPGMTMSTATATGMGGISGMPTPTATATSMGAMAMPSAMARGVGGMGAASGSALRPYLADPGMGAYQTFTINGHAYPDTAPVQAPPGTLVRLRLINVGYLTHVLHLHGTAYRLVATDGSAVNRPQETADLLPIAAAQRMDIEFRMPRGVWSLHDHDTLAGAGEMRVIVGQGARPSAADERAMRAAAPPLLDLARYGVAAPAPFTARGRFDRVFRLVLQGAKPSMPMGGTSGMTSMSMDTYTINGKLFMQGAPLVVRRGQRVEISFVNKSVAAHPMHLHGHRMQVLSLNGEPVTGAPLYQDTVMALPGKTTTVAFTADNPGVWMLHCHELHHAAAGMDTLLQYQGSPRFAQLGGAAGNNPE